MSAETHYLTEWKGENAREVAGKVALRADFNGITRLEHINEQLDCRDHQRKRDALLRLALHKKAAGIGQASMGAYMDDIASDLATVCPLALELACAHIRRSSESNFFPSSKVLADTGMAIQTALGYLSPCSVPPPRLEHKPRPKYQREEDSEGGKARRSAVVDFLQQQGQWRDEWTNPRLYSNYFLESIAGRFGYQVAA